MLEERPKNKRVPFESKDSFLPQKTETVKNRDVAGLVEGKNLFTSGCEVVPSSEGGFETEFCKLMGILESMRLERGSCSPYRKGLKTKPSTQKCLWQDF